MKIDIEKMLADFEANLEDQLKADDLAAAAAPGRPAGAFLSAQPGDAPAACPNRGF